MENNHKIAVIGGGGRTGKYLVSQLLKQGFQLKILLRDPQQASFINSTEVEIIQGDVLDYQSVSALIKDCRSVISTVGQRKDEPLVASQATMNVLRAMEENELPLKRYILVAGLNVDTPTDQKGTETLAATEWMKTNFPLIHEDRQRSYRILEENAAEWTLVRVPYIEFTDERGEVAVSLEDSPGRKISAANIAGFLISQLDDRSYIRKAPFISNI